GIAAQKAATSKSDGAGAKTDRTSPNRMDLTQEAIRAARQNPNREVASKDTAAKENAARTRERTERTFGHPPRAADGRITGVGFPFNSSKPAEGATNRYIEDQTAANKAALGDSNAILHADVGASRPGTEKYNKDLTDRRGAALISELRAAGVKAQIVIDSGGEAAAIAARKPEHQDDAGDRVATFRIERGPDRPPENGDIGGAVNDVMKLLQKPPDDKHAKEVGDMVVNSVKKGVEKTLKTGDPEQGMIEAAK